MENTVEREHQYLWTKLLPQVFIYPFTRIPPINSRFISQKVAVPQKALSATNYPPNPLKPKRRNARRFTRWATATFDFADQRVLTVNSGRHQLLWGGAELSEAKRVGCMVLVLFWKLDQLKTHFLKLGLKLNLKAGYTMSWRVPHASVVV